ncbi:MAG: AMP-binding protein [Actinomycetia bacterium]|nr:AMP-binding protein [Actinomycetes bacterium]MCP4084488.1 AMP-binding protein [Actinomycetes bacterium]
MENNIRYKEVIWTAFRTGLYITAVNSFLNAPEIEYILDDCDAQLVVSSRAKAEAAGTIDPRTANLMATLYQYAPDMVCLLPAPVYHAAPLGFSQAVHPVGGPLVIMERIDAAQCLADLERYQVTLSQFVPSMFVRMLKLGEAGPAGHDLSTLGVAIHATAPYPVLVGKRMIEWRPRPLVQRGHRVVCDDCARVGI